MWKIKRLPPGKEHYSHEIEKEFTDIVTEKRLTTTLLVAPPGLGKTYGIVRASVKTLAGIIPRQQETRTTIPEVIYILEPTHPALTEVATRVYKVSQEVERFVLPPLTCIFRGMHRSCINETLLETVTSYIENEYRKIATELGTDNITGTLLEKVVEYKETKNIDTLLDLIELQHELQIESIFLKLCQTCPYKKYTLTIKEEKTETKIDLVGELIEYVSRNYIDRPIDTETPKAEKLAKELEEHLEKKYNIKLETLPCPYRLLYKYATTETQYRHYRGNRKALIFMTHAMMLNPNILDRIRERYGRLLRLGVTVKHVMIIDEYDSILFSPPTVSLPLELAPRTTLITPDTVERHAKNYFPQWRRAGKPPTTLPHIKELIEYARGLYTEFFDTVTRGGLSRATHTIINRIIQGREKLTTLVKRAESFLTKWRAGIMSTLQEEGHVPREDIAVLTTCEKTTMFFRRILELDLEAMEHIQLTTIVDFPLLTHGEPTLRITPLQIGKRRTIITELDLGELRIPLFDIAARAVYLPTYPYPMLAKIGITATYSTKLQSYLLNFLSPRLRRQIEREKVETTELFAEYQGLKVYEAGLLNMPPEARKAIHRLITQYRLGSYSEVITYTGITPTIKELIETIITELRTKTTLLSETPRTRKEILTREQSEILPGYPYALDVAINTLIEAHYINRKELGTRDKINIILFTGTSEQAKPIITSLKIMYNRGDTAELDIPPTKIRDITIEDIKIAKTTLDWAETTITYRTERGKTYQATLAITYARSRYSRGIDLEHYDIAALLAPAQQPPTDIASTTVGNNYGSRSWITAVTATCQCLFRIIRRLRYEKPKAILIDYTALDTMMDDIPLWFKETLTKNMEMTPAVKFLRDQHVTPNELRHYM